MTSNRQKFMTALNAHELSKNEKKRYHWKQELIRLYDLLEEEIESLKKYEVLMNDKNK